MRQASLIRKTNETEIELDLDIDGEGNSEVETGMGFFDHMLSLFAKHSGCDLNVSCQGDLYVDTHHSVEDIGIVLGKAMKDALGDKNGIRRYGAALIPMDETLAEAAIDLSGRSYLVFNAAFTAEKAGEFPLEMMEEFFRALSHNAEMTLHINLRYGKNNHHMAEAIFKAFAHAFQDAATFDGNGVLSTKGVL